MNLDQFSRANESAKDSVLKSRLSSHSSCVLVHRAVIFTFADFPGSSRYLYYFLAREISYNSYCSNIRANRRFYVHHCPFEIDTPLAQGCFHFQTVFVQSEIVYAVALSVVHGFRIRRCG